MGRVLDAGIQFLGPQDPGWCGPVLSRGPGEVCSECAAVPLNLMPPFWAGREGNVLTPTGQLWPRAASTDWRNKMAAPQVKLVFCWSLPRNRESSGRSSESLLLHIERSPRGGTGIWLGCLLGADLVRCSRHVHMGGGSGAGPGHAGRIISQSQGEGVCYFSSVTRPSINERRGEYVEIWDVFGAFFT